MCLISKVHSSKEFYLMMNYTLSCFHVWFRWESERHSVVSDSLRPHGLYSQWNSPEQNTGVGSLSLLQGIFPTQGSNPGLPHCRKILYLLSHKGSPRMLEWVASPFFSGSSWPRNWTRVFCIAGGFFTTEKLSGKPVDDIRHLNMVLTWFKTLGAVRMGMNLFCTWKCDVWRAESSVLSTSECNYNWRQDL